jgi:outer membrane receptor for ferrienterochelin and colicin
MGRSFIRWVPVQAATTVSGVGATLVASRILLFVTRGIPSELILLLLALCAAAAAHAQESDFFDQKESYFQAQTIEGVSKRADAIADTPATVTVIDRDDIERYGFRTLADVLNFASVGSFTHNDRRYDFAGGRGLFFYEDFNTRILVMLNGHSMNEPNGESRKRFRSVIRYGNAEPLGGQAQVDGRASRHQDVPWI